MTKEIKSDSTLIDTWAALGTIIDPGETKTDEGWQLGEQPPHEYMNWIHNVLGKAVNYVLSQGVAEWNSTESYTDGAIVKGSDGYLYRSNTGTNQNNDPATGAGEWDRVVSTIGTDSEDTPSIADLVSLEPTSQIFTADGTWTKPSGCKRIKVIGIAGGAAGGGAPSTSANATAAGGGGGAGGGFILNLDATGLTSESITVGAGGVAANGADGGDGGDTSFGSFATASGGLGGPASSAVGDYSGIRGGDGGGSSGGDLDQPGQGGGSALRLGDRTSSGDSQEMVSMSGAGGAPGIYSGSGAAGEIAGGAAGSGNSGKPAQGYGGGGGGAANGSDNTDIPGGAGAPGILIVTEYYY